jgi:hypothetical protein
MLEGAMGGAIGFAVAGVTAAAVGKLKAWVQGMSATQEIVREVPGGGVKEDKAGDTCLRVEGSIITP